MNRFASFCLLTALTCSTPCFAKDARPDLATLLERMLLDSDMEAGKEAVERVKPGQPDAIPQLLGAIRSDHRMVRMMALELLGEHGAAARSALPELERMLDDPQCAAAALAAAVGLSKDVPEAYALVVRGLSHEASARAAVFAIGRFGPRAKGEVLAIAATLTRNPRLANPVGQALRQIEPELGAQALRSLLAHADPEVRGAAAQALRQVVPATRAGVRAGAEAEVEALSSGDRSAVSRAVYRLRGKGAAAAAAVPRLVEIVREDEHRLRTQAAQTLGSIGAPAAAELAELLAHEDARVVQAACRGLSAIKGEAGLPALPRLIELARSGEGAAFGPLQALGPHAAPAAPVLVSLLSGRQRRRVEAVLSALGSAALPALQQGWEEGAPRDALLRVLGGLECQDEVALSLARAGLRDSSVPVRTSAVAALAGQAAAGSRPALDELAELLLGRDANLRRAVSRALQQLGAKARPIAPRLLPALERDRAGDVAGALAAIGFEDPADAAPLVESLLASLERQLSRSLRPFRGHVRRRTFPALKSLRALGGEAARPALPRLLALIEHEAADVREAAATTLGAFGAVGRPAREPLQAQLERETDARAKRAQKAALARLSRSRTK